VSAFGFGGTNFHLVLEEYKSSQKPFKRLHSVAQAILISAANVELLTEKVKNALADLEKDDTQSSYLNLIKQSKNDFPTQEDPRLGFVVESPDEAKKFLSDALKLLEKQPDAESWDHPRGITYRSQGITQDDKIVALFPGQGSQYLNMIKELSINFPPVMQAYETMDTLFVNEGQERLSSVVYPKPVFSDEENNEQQLSLRETDYAQAGIGVASYGIYKILQKAGFQPDMTAGHSFGELSALWAGEAISDQAFMRLVKARGKAMRPPTIKDFDAGTMAAVKGPLKEIEKAIEKLDDVIIANENSPTQIVLAGPRQAIKKAEEALSSQGYKVTLLPVSAAFHTPLVDHASKPFAEAVSEEKFKKSKIPVYSNTTGKAYPPETKQSQQILSSHILHPVIFKTQIEEIYHNGGRVFVEIGPRQVLGNLVKDILDGKPHSVVSVNPSRDKSSDRQLREAVVTLQVIGLPIKDIDPYQQDMDMIEHPFGK
jgi:acyl transferase domain-containing protein